MLRHCSTQFCLPSLKAMCNFSAAPHQGGVRTIAIKKQTRFVALDQSLYFQIAETKQFTRRRRSQRRHPSWRSSSWRGQACHLEKIGEGQHYSLELENKMHAEHVKKFTSEGWLEAEVNVLLGIQAHDEAGHVNHLNGDLMVTEILTNWKTNDSPSREAFGDTSSMSLFKTVAIQKTSSISWFKTLATVALVLNLQHTLVQGIGWGLRDRSSDISRSSRHCQLPLFIDI